MARTAATGGCTVLALLAWALAAGSEPVGQGLRGQVDFSCLRSNASEQSEAQRWLPRPEAGTYRPGRHPCPDLAGQHQCGAQGGTTCAHIDSNQEQEDRDVAHLFGQDEASVYAGAQSPPGRRPEIGHGSEHSPASSRTSSAETQDDHPGWYCTQARAKSGRRGMATDGRRLGTRAGQHGGHGVSFAACFDSSRHRSASVHGGSFSTSPEQPDKTIHGLPWCLSEAAFQLLAFGTEVGSWQAYASQDPDAKWRTPQTPAGQADRRIPASPCQSWAICPGSKAREDERGHETGACQKPAWRPCGRRLVEKRAYCCSHYCADRARRGRRGCRPAQHGLATSVSGGDRSDTFRPDKPGAVSQVRLMPDCVSATEPSLIGPNLLRHIQPMTLLFCASSVQLPVGLRWWWQVTSEGRRRLVSETLSACIYCRPSSREFWAKLLPFPCRSTRAQVRVTQHWVFAVFISTKASSSAGREEHFLGALPQPSPAKHCPGLSTWDRPASHGAKQSYRWLWDDDR